MRSNLTCTPFQICKPNTFLEPEEEEVCWFQGDEKVMAWVVLVDGRALMVRWMEDKQSAQLPSLACNIFECCRKKSGQKYAYEQEDNGIGG